MPQLLGYVGSPAMCSSNGGWYYENPVMPAAVKLCPQSCDPVKAKPDSRVQVLFGCPRIGPGSN